MCLTCEELVGVTWRLSDCEELVWGLLSGDDGGEMIINTISGAGESGNQELESVKRPRQSQTDLRFVFDVQADFR